MVVEDDPDDADFDPDFAARSRERRIKVFLYISSFSFLYAAVFNVNLVACIYHNSNRIVELVHASNI